MILLAAFGLTGASALGSTIVGFEVTGVDGNVASLTAATINPNLTATPLVRSSELNPNAGANSFNSSGWNITDTLDLDEHYISFSFQAEVGYFLSVDSLTYRMQSSNTAPNTGLWGYSINGGSFELQNEFIISSGAGGGDGSWSNLGIVDQIGTVEFRYWQYGETSVNSGTAATTGTSRIRNLSGEDLVVTGSVTAIPEPSTLVLVGMSALAAYGILRRRK